MCKMFVDTLKFCRSLSTKTILITGSNEGIGFQTALALASKGHKIIMADKADLTESKNKIVKKTSNSEILTKFVDFTCLDSIRKFSEEIHQEEKLDVLLNNVGVFCLGKERTQDGLQATMQVNHFGPFLLTHLLEDLLAKSAPSRVLFVSSLGAFFHRLTLDNLNNPDVAFWDGFSSLLVYYNSKLCNMIVANGFAKKFQNIGISVNSFHPGMTATSFLWKHQNLANPFRFWLQSADIGAQNAVFLATDPSIEKKSGFFFVDFKEHQQPRIAENREFCEAIWKYSEYFVNINKEC